MAPTEYTINGTKYTIDWTTGYVWTCTAATDSEYGQVQKKIAAKMKLRDLARLPPIFIINTKTFMGKLSAMVRRLLDDDVKTLIKAGFVSESMELTDKGKVELLSFLLIKHKDDLVKEAKAVIEEEKENKE